MIVENGYPIYTAASWHEVDQFLDTQRRLLTHTVTRIDRQLFVGSNTVTTSVSTFTEVAFVRNRVGWSAMLTRNPTQTMSCYHVHIVPDLALST